MSSAVKNVGWEIITDQTEGIRIHINTGDTFCLEFSKLAFFSHVRNTMLQNFDYIKKYLIFIGDFTILYRKVYKYLSQSHKSCRTMGINVNAHAGVKESSFPSITRENLRSVLKIEEVVMMEVKTW